jgi:pimeloyl-ACP methyl ester carboxylesterase
MTSDIRVHYRFAGFVLDAEKRSLAGASGATLTLQPLALACLLYLVQHRERAVTKRELMGALWPDAVVSDASLHRIISILRRILGPQSIRTLHREGYRLQCDVEVEGVEPASGVSYVRSADAHIAYRTLGEKSSVDIVMILGWACPMQALFELPEARAQCHALAQLGRLVLFDKRGTGLSDRGGPLPDLATRTRDLTALLDKLASRRVVLIGISEGGPLALSFAASSPKRVAGLVLAGAFAQMTQSPEEVAKLRNYVLTAWGRGATFTATMPHRAATGAFLAWAQRGEQTGASPGAALDLLDINLATDVREVLAQITCPTIVVHHEGDRVVPFASGAYLAEHIRGASLVRLPGDDHLTIADRPDPLVAAVRAILA